MIVQTSAPVEFDDTPRIVVPLKAPSAAGSILVLGVVMVGRSVGLRVSDNLAMPRWRQANADGRTALWYRIESPHPGVTQVIIETANAVKITGHALLAETAGLNTGAAVQALSDLLVEARQGQAEAASRARELLVGEVSP